MRRWKWHEWRQGILTGLLLFVSLWIISLIWNLAGKAQVAVREAHSAENAYQSLEARKATLQANLANLATPRGQDAAIRQAFGVAKPGEEVIVVVPPATSTLPAPRSWWQRVLGWF